MKTSDWHAAVFRNARSVEQVGDIVTLRVPAQFSLLLNPSWAKDVSCLIIDCDEPSLNCSIDGSPLASPYIVIRGMQQGTLDLRDYPGSVSIQGKSDADLFSQAIFDVEDPTSAPVVIHVRRVGELALRDLHVKLESTSVGGSLAPIGDVRAANSLVICEAPIGNLVIEGMTRLASANHRVHDISAAGTSPPMLACSGLTVFNQVSSIDFELKSARQKKSSIGFDRIAANAQVGIAADDQLSQVVIRQSEGKVTVTGRIQLFLSTTASLLSLAGAEANGYVPHLVAGNFSSVALLAGSWNLERANHATLVGKNPEGFRVKEIIKSSEDSQGSRPLDGASIENVLVEPTSAAPLVFNLLQQCAFVSPIVKGTPVKQYTLPSRMAVYLGLRDHPAHHREQHDKKLRLRSDALYIRSLALVAADKGAPGSVRTAANWASYRMRAIGGAPWPERSMLFLYRLIGYGERPVPAFVTWLLGVAFVTYWNLRHQPWQFTGDGWRHFFETLGFWAIPTFGLASLPELPSGDEYGIFTFLVHALLAIPFVTGVLALRNYLKGDRPAG